MVGSMWAGLLFPLPSSSPPNRRGSKPLQNLPVTPGQLPDKGTNLVIGARFSRSGFANRKMRDKKTANQFDARPVFLIPSVDTWLNHPDNPRIGQVKNQSESFHK
jgi:hypothetical protein